MSRGRDHLATGPGKNRKDTTGWYRTRHEVTEQERKIQAGTKWNGTGLKEHQSTGLQFSSSLLVINTAKFCQNRMS